MKYISTTEPYWEIVLAIEDEKCDLRTIDRDGNVSVFERDSLGVLLEDLLNAYDCIDNEANALNLFRLNCIELLPIWMIPYDLQKLRQIKILVNDIYESNSESINMLLPNQRFRIWLAFQDDPFVLSITMQPYAYSSFFTYMSMKDGNVFSELVENLRAREKCSIQHARYEVGCAIAREHSVNMPHLTQYWFDDPVQLVAWLVVRLIDKNKYIKRCELCGNYYVPLRNSKRFCSSLCVSRHKSTSGLCGDKELLRRYKQVNSILYDKVKRAAETGRKYYIPPDKQTELDPRKFMYKFHGDNTEELKKLREVYDYLANCNTSEERTFDWVNAREHYCNWLDEQKAIAQSLKILPLDYELEDIE